MTNEFYDGEKSYYDEKLPELNAVTNEYQTGSHGNTGGTRG